MTVRWGVKLFGPDEKINDHLTYCAFFCASVGEDLLGSLDPSHGRTRRILDDGFNQEGKTTFQVESLWTQTTLNYNPGVFFDKRVSKVLRFRSVHFPGRRR